MMNSATKPGPGSLKKCSSCGQWKGALTFVNHDHKTVDRCQKCREAKKFKPKEQEILFDIKPKKSDEGLQ